MHQCISLDPVPCSAYQGIFILMLCSLCATSTWQLWRELNNCTSAGKVPVLLSVKWVPAVSVQNDTFGGFYLLIVGKSSNKIQTSAVSVSLNIRDLEVGQVIRNVLCSALCYPFSTYWSINSLKHTKHLTQVGGLRSGCVCSYAGASMAPWGRVENVGQVWGTNMSVTAEMGHVSIAFFHELSLTLIWVFILTYEPHVGVKVKLFENLQEHRSPQPLSALVPGVGQLHGEGFFRYIHL